MRLPWRKKKEQDVLVCVGIDEEHVELSELDVCRDCGAQVWVSPSGRDLQAEKNLKLICKNCVATKMESDENWAVVVPNPPTAEQMREIMNHLRGRS